MACRHRVMEPPLAVFGSLFGPAGGSAITMLRKFQQSWPHIGQATNEVASDDIFDAHTSALRDEETGEILQGSSRRFTSERRLRGILELSMIFQDGAKGARVSFQAPGDSIMHAG